MDSRLNSGRIAESHGSRGFSLVEVMIALVVGLFLLAGIMQLLVSTRVSYRVGEQVSRIQENGRYVVNLFAGRARGALSMGCRNAMMEIPLDGVSPVGDALVVNSCLLREDTGDCGASLADNKSVVRIDAALGYDASEQENAAGWLRNMPDGPGNAVADRWLRGDVLVVWGTEGAGTYVSAFTEALNAETGESEITGMTLEERNRELGAGAEAALITNCEQSHLFDIEESDGAILTIGAGSGEALSGNYDIPDYDATGDFGNWNALNKAVVYPFSYEAYFVCCTDMQSGSLVSDDPQGACTGASDRYRPSICRWRAGGDTQALVSEVADMRVTYSGHTDDGDVAFRASDRDTIHTAAWVSAQREGRGVWSMVIGAQVELLMTSYDPVRFGGAGTEAPINLRWPPNDPDTGTSPPNPDTLGYALRTLTDNRRLFERYVISAAFRARAPWFVEP